MEAWIIAYEPWIRMVFFGLVFAVMAVWEILRPCRALQVSKVMRWRNNLTLIVLNALMLRIVFPGAAIGVAVFAEQRGWGILQLYPLALPWAILVSVIALDFVIWLQHVVFHAVPALWRLHRVHHADLDYDVTTGARFHPLEIALSMFIKMAAIALLGAPVVAVIVFEILLNATAMFNHGNVRLPKRLDWLLRWILVTPDMHRVHHSVEDDEANSNFGFNLSWWDRLLGTYREQPRKGHQSMAIGIRDYRDPRWVIRLAGILAFPFVMPVRGYAINQRRWSNADEND